MRFAIRDEQLPGRPLSELLAKKTRDSKVRFTSNLLIASAGEFERIIVEPEAVLSINHADASHTEK